MKILADLCVGGQKLATFCRNVRISTSLTLETPMRAAFGTVVIAAITLLASGCSVSVTRQVDGRTVEDRYAIGLVADQPSVETPADPSSDVASTVNLPSDSARARQVLAVRDSLAAAGGHVVVLSGRHPGWLDTGIYVPAAATVRLVARGHIVWDPNNFPQGAGPEGGDHTPRQFGSYVDRFLFPDSPVSCLIGRIGDTAFVIGHYKTFVVHESGRLQLAINELWDGSCWDDNSGRYIADVTLFDGRSEASGTRSVATQQRQRPSAAAQRGPDRQQPDMVVAPPVPGNHVELNNTNELHLNEPGALDEPQVEVRNLRARDLMVESAASEPETSMVVRRLSAGEVEIGSATLRGGSVVGADAATPMLEAAPAAMEAGAVVETGVEADGLLELLALLAL